MSCCKYVTICGLIYASNVSQCSEFSHAWFLDLQVLSSRYFCSLVSVYILCISLIYFFACVSVVASCYLKSSISDAFYLVLLHFSCCSWLMLALFLFAFLRVKIFPLPLVKFSMLLCVRLACLLCIWIRNLTHQTHSGSWQEIIVKFSVYRW